jgi:hypothetical protein
MPPDFSSLRRHRIATVTPCQTVEHEEHGDGQPVAPNTGSVATPELVQEGISRNILYLVYSGTSHPCLGLRAGSTTSAFASVPYPHRDV